MNVEQRLLSLLNHCHAQKREDVAADSSQEAGGGRFSCASLHHKPGFRRDDRKAQQ